MRKPIATLLPCRPRRFSRALVALLPLLLAFTVRAAVPSEYQVKAAFLYNFTKFVEWPPARFETDHSPIVIAILGHDPIGPELTGIVRHRIVNGRPIVVQAITRAPAPGTPFPPIHILFVPSGEDALFRSSASAFSRQGILTVGESPGFTDEGGMINFVLIDDKVRFEIDRAHADSAGVKISAQLLKLARRPRP